jgi:hypothetical protein
MTQKAPAHPRDAAADAAYIAGMAQELAAIARRHGFHTLGYLLDMAKLEAESFRERNRPG